MQYVKNELIINANYHVKKSNNCNYANILPTNTVPQHIIYKRWMHVLAVIFTD